MVRYASPGEWVANLESARDAIRKPLDSLLSGPSPDTSAGDSEWDLELLGAIAVGSYTDRTSQVWRCDVRRG